MATSLVRFCFTVLNVVICLFLFCAVLNEFYNLTYWIEAEAIDASERPLQCFNKPQHGLTYQHGSYWVLSNARRAERSTHFHCSGYVSVTLQGYYTDVNSLLRLAARMFYGYHISFAVYVPNREHAMRVVDTIRYAQYCRHEKAELMAVHLYFRHRQNLIDMAKLRRELRKPHYMSECLNLGITLANTSLQKIEENADAIIVGKNIAQLEAETLFTLPLGGHAIASTRILPGILRFLVHISRCKESDKLKKTIFFLPTILTNVLGLMIYDNNYRLNNKEDVKTYNLVHSARQPFYFDAGDADWVQASEDDYNCPLTRRRFSDELQHLLAFPNNFLTLSNDDHSLLEENHQLSVVSSQRLRVFELMLKEFKFIKYHRFFVLQNVSSYERAAEFKLSAFNSSILQQYRIMYSPSDPKKIRGTGNRSTT